MDIAIAEIERLGVGLVLICRRVRHDDDMPPGTQRLDPFGGWRARLAERRERPEGRGNGCKAKADEIHRLISFPAKPRHSLWPAPKLHSRQYTAKACGARSSSFAGLTIKTTRASWNNGSIIKPRITCDPGLPAPTAMCSLQRKALRCSGSAP